MIGLCITIINFEQRYGRRYEIDEGQLEYKVYPDPMENPRNALFFTNVLRLIGTFTSLMSVFCNFRRYQLKMSWLDWFYHSRETLNDNIRRVHSTNISLRDGIDQDSKARKSKIKKRQMKSDQTLST